MCEEPPGGSQVCTPRRLSLGRRVLLCCSALRFSSMRVTEDVHGTNSAALVPRRQATLRFSSVYVRGDARGTYVLLQLPRDRARRSRPIMRARNETRMNDVGALEAGNEKVATAAGVARVAEAALGVARRCLD